MDENPYLTLYIETNSSRTEDLTVKGKMKKLLENKTAEHIPDLWWSKTI